MIVKTRSLVLLIISMLLFGMIKTLIGEEKEIDKEEERRKLVLAKIGDKVITVGEFEDYINKRRGRLRALMESEEKQREVLDNYIDMYLMYLEAKRRGLQNRPNIIRAVKRMMATIYEQKEVDSKIDPESIPMEDIEAYYKEHYDLFNSPERIRIRQIIIHDKEKAEKLLKKILKEKPDIRKFMKLAYEYSDEPVTKRTRGRTRPFPRLEEKRKNDPDIDPAIVKAAFTLKKDQEVYPKLIKTSKGYHIIMRERLIKAINRPLEQVSEQIRRRLWQERIREARKSHYEELKKRYNPEIHEENIKYVVVDLRGRFGYTRAPFFKKLKEKKKEKK